ncbi:MAG: hypothetical protein UDM11_00900, partial [Oscillospiraceae bacterium]|nr:hypothetical protein [Oscillospiraceae bacterium]
MKHLPASFPTAGYHLRCPEKLSSDSIAHFSSPEKDKKTPAAEDGGHKKVISYFVGTAWLWSRRFLFQQFFHG